MQWGMQYAVGVGAKRSTHTVDTVNGSYKSMGTLEFLLVTQRVA